jgi:hypothetical protein
LRYNIGIAKKEQSSGVQHPGNLMKIKNIGGQADAGKYKIIL